MQRVSLSVYHASEAILHLLKARPVVMHVPLEHILLIPTQVIVLHVLSVSIRDLLANQDALAVKMGNMHLLSKHPVV